MQLGGRSSLPRPADLAAALTAAAQQTGHRPAVTVLAHERREEQGFASLAQWAAKGAHLLETDYALGPDGRVQVSPAAGWMTTAACLAVWWCGASVVVGRQAEAEVAIVHETFAPEGAPDVLWFGDAADGSPVDPELEPAYAIEVQVFPDQPPPPRAASDLGALETPDGSWTHAAVIDEVRDRWGTDAVLGIEITDDLRPEELILAVAARPVVTGRPTVVLAGVDREAAAPERVGIWLEDRTAGSG